jgi:muramoyltetrapeptide carboxypeptidase
VSAPVLTRPGRLSPGDRVAVVAPSGPIEKDRLDAGCEILRSWGLDVVVGAHVTARHEVFGYLAGTDADRAADLTEAWCDPTVSAVLCARGGYGVQRMVDLLDWTALRAAGPKILAGYSDITALHEAFATSLGLATLHAPMVAAQVFASDGFTSEQFRRTLFEPERVQTLTSPGARALVPGTARGVTVGGCLSLLAAETGTPTGRADASGGIVLLEDVGEKAYRIDGFLTHLRRAGWFDGVAGVALGSWQDCEPVEDLLRDRLGDLGVPVIWELGFGHGERSLTVPLGVPATIDADTATLTVEVPALR